MKLSELIFALRNRNFASIPRRTLKDGEVNESHTQTQSVYIEEDLLGDYMQADACESGGQYLVYDEDFCQWVQLERLVLTLYGKTIPKGAFVTQKPGLPRFDFRADSLEIYEPKLRKSTNAYGRGVTLKSDRDVGRWVAMSPGFTGLVRTRYISCHESAEEARAAVASWEMACLDMDLQLALEDRPDAAERKSRKRLDADIERLLKTTAQAGLSLEQLFERIRTISTTD